MLLYDPAGGSYAFSYIGYNGTMAGGGNTEDSRWDDALKYRLAYGPVHFGAMYKFADGSGGCYSATAGWTSATCAPESAHNNAYGFNLGGKSGKFSADIRLSTLQPGDQRIEPVAGAAESDAAISVNHGQHQYKPNHRNQSDRPKRHRIWHRDRQLRNYGRLPNIRAERFKFFAGYEYIWQNNPKHPLGIGASDQGGYFMSGVEDNNLDSEKLVNIWWTGVKYTYRSKTDFIFSWYQQRQNDFRVPPTCSPSAGFRASCAGTLNEGSLYVDHHFTKRFDGFAGIAYSWVSGGLAIAIPHGPGVPYNYNNNCAPTVGGRFIF